MKRSFLFLISFVILMTTYAQQSKPALVLVHGAWYGNYAWTKLTPLLKSKGITVVSFDLPGYAGDKSRAAEFTLDDYVKKVATVANGIPGKVILLGHSMGGAIISAASEVLGPEKVEKLIFLDAFLLQNGQSILAQVSQMDAATAAAGNAAEKKLILNFLEFSEDRKLCVVPADKKIQVFCHDCPKEDVAVINANPVWQPVAALATPISVSDSKYGVIPKYFIQCVNARDLDRSSILNNVKLEKVYTLPSSHSPFFSMPEKLAEIISDINGQQPKRL
jgi:acetyl esterase/lipase